MNKILAVIRVHWLRALMLAGFVAALILLNLCAPTTSQSSLTARSSGFSPINAQGGAVQTSFAGIIDPTNPQWAGGLVCHAAAGASTALADQNRAAMQATLAYASSHNMSVYVPPCGGYPMGRASGQAYSVDFSGLSNITIQAYGATFRMTGDATSTPFSMFFLRNTSHVWIYGATFSHRDVMNSTADTVSVLLGDGGTTNTDDVHVVDSTWLEGVGGDYVRLDGGSSTATVTRVQFTRGDRFENSARAAIDIRPGVQRVEVSYDWFRSNYDRDVYCEATSDNLIGQLVVFSNVFERSSSTMAPAITVSGYGSTNDNQQTQVTDNKITDGTIEGVNLGIARIERNDIRFNVNRGSNGLIDLSGRVYDVQVVENYLERGPDARQTLTITASNGPAIRTSSSGGNSPSNVLIKSNRILQFSGIAPAIDVSDTTRAQVLRNSITYHNSTADSGSTGFSGVYCLPTSTNACSVMAVANKVKRGDQPIKASLDLHTVTTHDDTVVQADLYGVYGNSITVQFIGDAAASAGTQTSSGTAATFHYKAAATTIAQMETLIGKNALVQVKTTGTGSNVLQVGDAFGPTPLAGGVQAGRMLAGANIAETSGHVVDAITLRDNYIDGAAEAYSVGGGSSTYPDGVPLLSGNWALNVATEIAGGFATTGWQTERTPQTETIASGAAGVTIAQSFLTTANTVSYTQADSTVDGFRHCYKIKSTSGTPLGTMTPAHLADGTVHTVTWSATGGSWCMVWDKTGSTYRIQGTPSGVTVN